MTRSDTPQKLRLDDSLFRLLFERSQTAIMLVAPDGRPLEINPAWRRLWGGGLADVEAYNILEDEQLRANAVLPLVERAFQGEHASTGEFRYDLRGEPRLVSAQLDPIFDGDGRVQAVAVFFEEVLETSRLPVAIVEHPAAPTVFVKSLVGRYLFVNAQYLRAWGVGRDRIIGKTDAEIYPPELAELFRETDRQLIERGEPASLETSMTIDGQQVHHTVAKFLLRDSSGVPYAICGIATDITDRVRAEQALRESEEKHRSLYTNTPVMMHSIDETGQLVSVSNFWLETLGYESDEVLGRKSVEFLTPESRKHAEEVLLPKLFETGACRDVALQFVKRDGEVIDVLLSALAEKDESGKVVRSLAVLVDVTERKRAEAALRASEERYRDLFESSPISLWEEDFSAVKIAIDELRVQGLVDLRRYLDDHPEEVMRFAGLVKILQVNRATVELAEGESEEDFLARLGLTFTEETYDVFREELIALAEGRTTFEAETRGRTLRGNELWYEIKLSVSPGHEDTWGKVLVSGIDVTARKRAEEALRASDRRFAVAFDSSPVTLSISTLADGRFVAVNHAGQRVFGYTEEESVGRTAAELGIWFDFGERDNLVEGIEEGESRTAEVVLRTKRGEPRTYVLSVARFDIDGEAYLLSSANDVTEQKRAEEALRSSERRFAVAFDSSPVTLAITTLEDGRFVAVNSTALRLFDMTLDEVVGHTALELGIWVDYDERARLFGGLEEGETRTDEVEFRMKNGEVRTHLLSVARFDADGQSYLLTAGLDMTERKAAEEALRAAEAKYRTLVEQLPLVTYAMKLDTGEGIYVSPQVEALLGYGSDELLAERHIFGKLLHPDDRESTLTAMANARERGSSFAAEHRLVARDGSIVWVRNQYETVRDAEGRPLVAQGFFIDITAEKATREEHERLEAELRQSQRLEAVGRLAGGLAHDFNNLLTAIGGYTEFLLESLPDDGHLRSDAEEIRKGVDRASSLTRQLLAFTRRQVVERESLDLNEIVTEMDRFLRRLIGTDIELVAVLEPELGHVEADRSQLEQVIVNLALNARDAMPTGGKLVIETANLSLEQEMVDAHAWIEPGEYVTLSVRDTGVGMDPEISGRVFEPFFTTKEVGHGTGLGLSTVYGIVEQSGGRIYVYTEPSRGTTFKIYLPRTEAAAAAKPAPPAALRSLAGSETVLLVEDEEVLRTLAARTLRSQGYEVLEARYATEALELWGKHHNAIDVVVSDIVMPGMSGVELAERLATERPGTPILLMSGFSDADVVERVPPSSRGGFLGKPFTPNGLLSAVRQAVERA